MREFIRPTRPKGRAINQPQVPLDLRARKRRATENAIETAAVDLALEHGIAGVTIEAICQIADISRSTFFNYFAGRDYAIIGRALRPLPIDETHEVFASAPADLVRGVYRLIFASIGHTYVQSEVARKRTQLITEQPAAQQIATSIRAQSNEMLVTSATQWLVARPDLSVLADPGQEARFAVSVASLAALTTVAQSAEAEGDVETNEDSLDHIIQMARLLLTIPGER